MCYYGPEARISWRPTFYWATYAVYRLEEDSEGDVRYRRLSEIYRAVRYANAFQQDPLVDGEVQTGGFTCYDDEIDVGESPFIVQEGDIIGACVFDGDDTLAFDRRQLNVVGETSGESLMEADDDCNGNELPSNVLREDLDTIPSRRLHIKANIGMIAVLHHACNTLNIALLGPVMPVMILLPTTSTTTEPATNLSRRTDSKCECM